jgi:hypothetical protein
VHRGEDPAAELRLAQSDREHLERRSLIEQRDVTTSNVAGLVVPQYLTERLSPAVRAARPLCDAIGEDLPDEGMEITVPKVTTAATAAAQNAENAGVSTSDPATTAVTVAVRTASASIVVSRQMFERAGPSTDLLIGRELLGALEAETERLVINGSGASGEPLGLLGAATGSTTYTDGTPTAAEFFPKLGAALTASSAALQRVPPDVVVSNPRLWFWLGSVGETVRPPVDLWEGIDRIGSNSMPTNLGAGTNETRLIAFPRAAVHVALGPAFVAIDTQSKAGTLGVRIVAHRYLAVAALWPAAVVVLAGTGMAATAS